MGRALSARRLLAWVLVALAATQVALAGWWTVVSFADVPHYGDSFEMIETAETLEFVEGRMIAYPYLLRGVHGLFGGDWFPPDPHYGDQDWSRVRSGEPLPCPAPAWTGVVQVLQAIALLGALAFAARTVAGLGLGTAVALGAVLTSDPWVLMHAGALMTDALALAAAALFVAAATAFLRGGRTGWLALLALSQLAASTLRWERSLVMVAALAGVLLGMLLLARRSALPLRRRAGVLFLIGLVGHPVAGAVNGLAEARPLLFSPAQYWLHQRVLAGALVEAYPDLSPETRAVLSLDQARRYDQGVSMHRRVMPEVTGGDRELLTAITDDMVSVVWPRRAPRIVRRTLSDVGLYLVPTVVAYRRVREWRDTFYGLETVPAATLLWEPFEAAGAYCLYAFHDPRVSRTLWRVAEVVTVVGLAGGALVLLGRRRRASWLLSDEGLARVLPTLCVVGASACAFGLASALFEMRYALTSHVAELGLAYGLLASWIRRS